MRAMVEIAKLQRLWMSRFFQYFLWIALGSHIIWYFSGLIWPYYWNLLASVLGPFGVCLLTSQSSDDVASCLCGWSPEDIAKKDLLLGEINKIRFLKRQGNFDKALALVNDVLDQEPNFPEALYLKAHVLWEGFKNPWAAESYFRRVIEVTEDSQPVYRWASSCLSGLHSKVSH